MHGATICSEFRVRNLAWRSTEKLKGGAWFDALGCWQSERMQSPAEHEILARQSEVMDHGWMELAWMDIAWSPSGFIGSEMQLGVGSRTTA